MIRFEVEEGFYQTLDPDLIRSSFRQVLHVGPASIAKVYEYVFADYPVSIPLFDGVHWPHQYESMLKALGFIIDNLENEAAVRGFLFDLGKRHVKYGALNSNYEWVGNSFLKGLAYFYKSEWSVELSEEWRKFFVITKAMMMDGHNAAAESLERRTTQSRPDK